LALRKLTGVTHPFDYFMALERRAEAVRKNPADWFPSNYQKAVETIGSG
jgi:hypothetical protein